MYPCLKDKIIIRYKKGKVNTFFRRKIKKHKCKGWGNEQENKSDIIMYGIHSNHLLIQLRALGMVGGIRMITLQRKKYILGGIYAKFFSG